MSLPPFPDQGRARSPRKIGQAERVRLLEEVPLFAGLAKRHLRHIADVVTVELIDADQDLLHEGDAPGAAYLIVAGTAVVRRNGRKIADLGVGDFAGELSLLRDRPRKATVHSTSPLECLVLDRASLRAAVGESPELAWHLLMTVADRLAENATLSQHI